MIRGKKIGMFFTVIVTAVGLLVGTEVMAQVTGPCPTYPTDCNFADVV